MRAEVENDVAVVREDSDAQVDEIAQLIHGPDVRVGSTETGRHTFIDHAVLPRQAVPIGTRIANTILNIQTEGHCIEGDEHKIFSFPNFIL